jgi:hypothetical protein
VRPSFPVSSPAPSRPKLSRRPRPRAAHALAAVVGASALLATTPDATVAQVNTADAVIGYHPGDDNPDALFEHPEAALGTLNGDTGYGGLTPFNPPFSASDIVVIGPGGYLTLHTAVPFRTSGLNLGVFVNNGLVDVSDDGSGEVGPTPTYFSPVPEARVAVSADGANWEYLNGGDVILFDKPTNVYLDQPISNYFQQLGEQEADMGQPWAGELNDLADQDYAGILGEFAGSAGGNWLSLDGLALEQAEYVRFEAPRDARMVIDAISTTEALPEPSSALALLGGAFLLVRRTRRRG